MKLAKELNKPVRHGDVRCLDPEQEQFQQFSSKNASAFPKYGVRKSLPILLRTDNAGRITRSLLSREDCRKVVIDNPNHIAKMCDVIRLPRGCLRQNWRIRRNWSGWCTKKPGDELPKIVQDHIDLELRASSSGSTMSVLYSTQKLVADSMDTGYLVGSREGGAGSSIVAFLSGIS